MKERLEKFLKAEGLTPSRFAEIMGVQPSSISHILVGRNKPSFDFIEKMLSRFPKVNPDWLILGKGMIYRQPENQRLNILPSEAKIQFEAVDNPTLQFPPDTSGDLKTVSHANDDSIKPRENRSFATPAEHLPCEAGEINPPYPEKDTKYPDIEHVIVLYSDKTMTSYRPK